jgi:hypothetical protein
LGPGSLVNLRAANSASAKSKYVLDLLQQG